MTNNEAVLVIYREGLKERTSVTQYKHILAALKVLGITGEDERHILYEMDYHDENGNRRTWLAMKLGAKK